LAAALGSETIAEPPDSFGTIRARRLLASISSADSAATTRQHVPRAPRSHPVAERAEDDGTAADLFSSSVGGGGALGRLLGRWLGGGAGVAGVRTRQRTGRTPERGPAATPSSRPASPVPWKRLPSKAGGRSTPNGTFIDGGTARAGARCTRSSHSQGTARLC